MKLWAYILALVVLPLAVVTAQDDEQKQEGFEQRELLEFRRDSRSQDRHYSFEDYMNDLAATARSDQPLPDNPVSQLASNEKREYKPLNPMTILRW